MSRTAATRAVVHWAWRMFRRDWRGQTLVMVLLAVAVAVSSYGSAFAHALAPDDQASFGSANARIRLTASDPAVAATVASEARRRLGPVEEITDTVVAIPGSVEQLDLRAQNPHGVFGSSTLRLRAGRYPTGRGEIALTPGMARILGVHLGATVTLDERSWQVVGQVENPTDLRDAFGLVTVGPAGFQTRFELLAKASAGQLAAFREAVTVPGGVTVDSPTYYSRDLGVLLVGALGMVLVAVIALTAFLVLAQRRVRQLGMLAAIGATRRQVRNVTLAHGLIVGVIAAVVGTAASAIGWTLTSSLIAQASGRRVTWGSAPLWLILIPGLMGVIASVVAAWWPARTMARVPVVRALSDRPLEPPRGTHTALNAFAAFVVGVLCLRLAHQRNPALMIIGLVAMIGSILLTTPLAIRALTVRSRTLRVTRRLAWRELRRNQSRSAAALATVTMAVGISTAAVVVTAADTHPPTAGNLSTRQVLITAPGPRDAAVAPALTAGQTSALDGAAERVARSLPGGVLVPLSLAIDPGAPRSPVARVTGGLDAAQVVRRQGRHLSSYPLYVANPQLLAALGVDPARGDRHGYFATDPTGSWSLLYSRRAPLPRPDALHTHPYTALPQVVVSPSVVEAHGWQVVRAGWLVQDPTPVTASQERSARMVAAEVGLALETRDPQTYLGRLRWMFTLGGIAVTLAVIAIALVLLRIQTTRDQQILTAVGAPRRARRAIAATTAAALAAVGSILGISGACLTLVLAYSDTLDRLSNIPWPALVSLGLGIPVLALGTTWLTSSRQPPSINRPAID